MSFSQTALLFAWCVACKMLIKWPPTTAKNQLNCSKKVDTAHTKCRINICAGLDQASDRVGSTTNCGIVKSSCTFPIPHVDIDFVRYTS